MKKFEELFELGLHDNVVNAYLMHYKQGNMTQEEALVGMIFTLSEQKKEIQREYIDHLNNCTMPRIQGYIQG